MHSKVTRIYIDVQIRVLIVLKSRLIDRSGWDAWSLNSVTLERIFLESIYKRCVRKGRCDYH